MTSIRSRSPDRRAMYRRVASGVQVQAAAGEQGQGLTARTKMNRAGYCTVLPHLPTWTVPYFSGWRSACSTCCANSGAWPR